MVSCPCWKGSSFNVIAQNQDLHKWCRSFFPEAQTVGMVPPSCPVSFHSPAVAGAGASWGTIRDALCGRQLGPGLPAGL